MTTAVADALMESFVIEGGHPLNGRVSAAGNKNGALPILAACLLTDEPVLLGNVPRIRDVETMLALIADLGVDIEWTGPNEVRVHAQDVAKTELDERLCAQLRGSILLAGPLLSRCGHALVPPPGGDVIGRRRLDTHIDAFRGLGAEVVVERIYEMRAPALTGARLFLDEASVTGTENVLTAAVLAEGTTIIRNAASEPHVQDLCRLLLAMGARIEGVGSNLLVVHGVRSLAGADIALGADFMEVGSFVALAAVTGGEIEIRHAGVEDMRMALMVFRRLGVEVRVRGDDLLVPGGQAPSVLPDLGNAIPRIDDGPWPAFPADLMSVALVTATQASGTVLFHEKMYESRLFFVDRLIGMGARVVLCDPHRALVHGPSRLRGEPQGLPSPDIRAGIALVIAALCAEGRTVIRSVEQIDRGYEDIDDRLMSLGARVKRRRG